MVFSRYPKIYRLGHPKNKYIFYSGKIIIQEKMDGSNARFMWDYEQKILRFGSRNIELTDAKKVDERWKYFVDWARELNEKVRNEEVRLLSNHIYYIEYMIPHNIKYNNVPMFIGLDIYDTYSNRFLPFSEVCEYFGDLGIKVVPLLKIIDSSDVTNELLHELLKSKGRYGNKEIEGIVIKNYDLQVFAKLVNSKFSEIKEIKQKRKNDTEKIVDKYVTESRIEKKNKRVS